MNRYDAIVVGGGITGLMVGALLAKGRKKVVILEKSKQLGGRAYATMVNGHVIETGSHALVSGGHVERLMEKLGKQLPEYYSLDYTEIYDKGKWQRLNDIMSREEWRRFKDTEIKGTIYEEIRKLDDVPLKEWLLAKTNDEGIQYLMWHLAYSDLCNNKWEDMSTGEFLVLLKEHIEEHGKLSDLCKIVRGGNLKVVEILQETLLQTGTEIKTGAHVSRVAIEDSKARGVKVEIGESITPGHIVDTETIEAPVVICTVPLWDLFNPGFPISNWVHRHLSMVK